MSNFIRAIISVDDVADQLSGTIVMSKLMGYKVKFGSTLKGHTIVFKKEDRTFFKLKIIHKGLDVKRHRMDLAITIHALSDFDVFEKYQKIKHNYKVVLEDSSSVTRKGNDTMELCKELLDDLSYLL